jgi:hypothetical protein
MQELPKRNFTQEHGLDRFVALLPDLYYAVDRILDHCAGFNLSKKSAVVLWLIANSRTTDELGPYLVHDDIVEKVGEWFVLGVQNARS